jgi:transketolase
MRSTRRSRRRSARPQPTLICCKTNIGHGSPNRAGTAKAHGEALGAEEIVLTRASSAGRTSPS